MPWKDIGQQPTLQWISIGKDIDGDLYSKKEIRAVIEMVINKDSQPIKLLSYSLRQKLGCSERPGIEYTFAHAYVPRERSVRLTKVTEYPQPTPDTQRRKTTIVWPDDNELGCHQGLYG